MSKQYSYPKPYNPWLIWLVAGLFYLYEFIHRVAPSVMLPELSADFGVYSAALGSLSAYYYYAYATMQIPVGLLIDQYGARNLLTLAALLVSIGSLLFAHTEQFYLAKLSRAMIGLGSAFSFVGCLKLATTWFPSQRFALVVGLTNLLGVLGAIIGSRPLAILVDNTSWRYTLYLSAIIGLCFIFIIPAIIRDKSLKSTPPQDNSSLLADLGYILSHPRIWLIAIFGSLMVAPIAGLSELWGVSYLIDRYGLPRPQAAEISAITFLGIAIGGPLNGWLSDYLEKRRPILIAGALGAVLATTVIIYSPIQNIKLITLLHFVFGYATSTMLLCFALNAELAPRSSRATVIGFTNTIIMAMSALSQPLIGKLLDFLSQPSLLGTGATYVFSVKDYQIAFSCLIIFQLLALIIATFLPESNCQESGCIEFK